MKENIEEDIKRIENLIECFRKADFVKLENRKSIYQKCSYSHYKAIDHILLAYNKLQKENLRLRYQDIPFLEGEIKGYKARIEEVKKENEELKQKYDKALHDLIQNERGVNNGRDY